MRRLLVLTAAVAAAIILSKLLLEDVLGLLPEQVVREWIANAGAAGAIAVVALLAVDLFLPIPSSLVMILSGAAFGLSWGAALAFAGSISGQWLGFELVRRYGRRVSRRMVPDDELLRLEELFARHGAAAVAVTRALPVAMETMSVIAGLSTMTRGVFLVAAALGTAPVVIVYAYAGMMSRETGSLVPAVIFLIAIGGCGWIWFRARTP